MARIDIELVNRGFFETRSKAQFALKNKIVYCNNQLILKNSFDVREDDKIEIKGEKMPYVSKGGLKLEKAIHSFNVDLNNKKMIDIGSSTGGFSDCAIKNGISYILAVDVGTNQFSKKILDTGKVTLMENTDFRNIDNNFLKDIDIATIDVSFISVTKLISKIAQISNLKEIILLIKPQFECGADIASKYQGVVRNKKVHYDVIKKITSAFNNIDFYLTNLTFSPILGGSGNIEYLAYFSKIKNKISYQNIIDEAFNSLLDYTKH